LRFGEGICALLFDWVLRGHDDKGRLQRIRLAIYCHRQFLHGLEQGRLGFGGRAVDFVSEDQIGKDWSAVKHEFSASAFGIGLKNFGAGDVGGHEVRRKLNAAEVPSEKLGEGFHHEGFGETRHANHEHVAAGQQAGEQELEDVVLADQDFADVGLERSATFPQACNSSLG
jgi:hypothetical protein